MLFDHSWEGLDVHCLRMAYSEEMERIGTIGLHKIFHLWYLIRETRRFLHRHPGTVLLYPPASPHWVPFLRDVIYLTMVRRRAAKTVFLFHAGGFGEFVKSSAIARFLARAYQRPDLCLEVAIEDIAPHQVLNCPSWKWTPYGVEVPEVIRKPKLASARVNVLFVGSLQEGKGVLEVIKTAKHLKDRGAAARFQFILVGRWFSDAFRQQSLDLVKTLDVSEMVDFPGQKTGEEKWEAFAAADIFFFPSHYAAEAFPIVIIEALGAGLPVVSTEWRGIPSIVEGSGVARLLPVRQSEAYAEALVQTAKELCSADASATRARAFYMSRYTTAHFLHRISEAVVPLLKHDSGIATPAPTRDTADGPIEVLQLFNQYLERGGEELWVDQMLELAPPVARVRSLRFQSRTWVEKGRPNRLRQAALIWNNPASRRLLREEVARQKPDVLVFHNILPVGSLGLYDEAGLLGIPVVQYIHNFRPFSPSGTLWIKDHTNEGALNGHTMSEVVNSAWEGSLARTGLLAFYLKRFRNSGGIEKVSRWIAVSDFMRSKFIDAGIPAKRIFTLRHCWKPKATPNHLVEGDYYLFLGRLVPEKGIQTLLQAWTLLEHANGANCPRLIIGGTGPEEARVHRLALRSRRITFNGFVDGQQKTDLLSRCRALIVPSIWWEPLGLTVYEAYDYQRPVLAANTGGLSETVQHGRTGYHHEPGDPRSLLESLLRIETDGPEKRAAMGRTGRRWLETSANPDQWRSELHRLLFDLT